MQYTFKPQNEHEQRWGYNAYCSNVLYVNQGAILTHSIRASGHKFLYVNLQHTVNHCLCFVHTICRFDEIRCQSLSLEVNCGYARMAICELTPGKQGTNTHQIDKGKRENESGTFCTPSFGISATYMKGHKPSLFVVTM